MDCVIQNTNKLKILYLITKAKWGGAQKYVYTLAQEMSEKGYGVTVAAGLGDELIERLEKIGINTIRLPHLQRDVKIWSDIKTLLDLAKLILKEKPDVVHSNSSKMGLLAGLTVSLVNCWLKLKALATRQAKPEKIKSVFTAHGWAFNEERGAFAKQTLFLMQRLTIALNHQTIAVSKKTMEDMASFLGAGEKIKLIYNGTSPIDYLSKQDARKAVGDDIKEKLWIGTIAELHKNKGIDLLIRGFAKFAQEEKDSALVVIGAGEEENALRDLVGQLGLKNRVHLLGQVANAARYAKAFDIFILSSRTEALPYVILEVGPAEVPIIASRVGGIPEIINHLKSGILIRPGDSKEIYLAIIHLLTNRTETAVCAKNLSEKIQKKFSGATMAKATSTLYKAILNHQS